MIITGVLFFMCTISIFLLAGKLVSPWLIEHTAAGGKVRGEISRLIDGVFDFKQVDLSFFPAPHVLLVQADITIPQHVNATVASIALYPHILPLLKGHLTLKKMVVRGPVITVVLPDSTAESQKTSQPFEMSEALTDVANLRGRLPEFVLPATVATISGGRINLVSGKKALFSLHDVEAELQNGSKELTCRVTALSDIFASLSAGVSIEAGQGDMKAHAELKKVQIGKAYSAFFPDAELKIDDDKSDINVDLTVKNSDKLTVEFEIDTPLVHLSRAGGTVNINMIRFAGGLGYSGDGVTLTLSELLLDNPAMSISGSFTASGKEPKFHLQLDGREIDVTATRSAVLAMAGGNSTLQTLFSIVKGGTVPLMTVSSLADAPGELGDWAHLVLQSDILKAEVEIPGVNLDFTDVSGDVKLSQGILTVEKLQGRLQNSAIEGGRLTLDLTKDPLPLHFESGVDADMADIPAIISTLVEDRDFRKELTLINDVQGKATGKLLLDGDTDGLQVDVSTTDLHLVVRHPEIPSPLAVDGGSVTYDGERLAWKQLNGATGTSTFAGFSGELGLGKIKDFEITSGTSRIFIAELLPWLFLHEKTRRLAGYFGGGKKGILQLSKLTLGGPLKDYQNWHFDIAGEIENLIVHNEPYYPGPITIGALKFTVDPDNFAYSDGQLGMLDTSLTISGRHRRYLTDFTGDISLSFAGQVGPQTIQWFEQSIKTPAWLKPRPFSLTTSHLTFTKGEKSEISATLGLPDDLEVFANVSMDAKEVVVKKLTVNDTLLTLSGVVRPVTAGPLQVSLDVTADRVDVDQIMKTFGIDSTPQYSTVPALPLPITGVIRFKTPTLLYKTLKIEPLQADFRFHDETVDITLRDAGLCRIPLSGSIAITPQDIAFHLIPDARNQPLNRTLNCFADRRFKADGAYDAAGSFRGRGPLEELLGETSGHMDLSIADGHIYHDIVLLNVIKFLNITEVISDRVTARQMEERGLGFKRFESHITLQDGKLQYGKLILQADELVLTGIGEIDLFKKDIDFTLLAAPQTTVNALLGEVPLLGGILQTITAIPLRITGTIDDVHVLPLTPSAVGYELRELTKQTLGVSMKLVHMNEFRKEAGSDGT